LTPKTDRMLCRYMHTKTFIMATEERNRISFADFAGMDTDSQKSSGEKDFEA
jgi:hypothetical protein